MAIVRTDDQYYHDIADAIREKTGGTEDLLPENMAEELNAATLEELTVTPSSEVQTFEPTSPCIGFSIVTVEAAESGGGGGEVLPDDGENYPDAENVNFGTTVSGKDLYTGKYFYGTCPYATKLPEVDESTTEKPYIVLAKFSPSGSIGVYFTSVKPYVMNSNLVIQGADFDEWKLNAETGELEFVASYSSSSTSPTCSEFYWANFELTNRSGSRVYLIPTEPVPETTMEIEYTATGETYTISGATLNALGAVTQQITGIEATTPSAMVAALQMYAGTH